MYILCFCFGKFFFIVLCPVSVQFIGQTENYEDDQQDKKVKVAMNDKENGSNPKCLDQWLFSISAKIHFVTINEETSIHVPYYFRQKKCYEIK